MDDSASHSGWILNLTRKLRTPALPLVLGPHPHSQLVAWTNTKYVVRPLESRFRISPPLSLGQVKETEARFEDILFLYGWIMPLR